MQQSVATLSVRERYTSTKWNQFLWWLATAEKELLVDCVIDRNRYAIIGYSVLGTWLFATLAWTYFFTTVVSNLFAAFALGLFMGAIILSIDRALIKGINKFNKNKFAPLLLRGLMALTIGVFMAQPALLYMFNKEIHVQISLDNGQKKRDKRSQQDTVFFAAKNELLTKKQNLQTQLDSKYKEVATARNNFIAETDGTGGSKKIGLEAIAKAKQREYTKLDAEYVAMQALLQPQLQLVDSALAAIETTINKEQSAFDTLLNDGFLTRIEALNNLVKSNAALEFRYYLLIIILMLIELMPVIAKTLLPAGTYDEKVQLREQMEKEIITSNIQQEQQLKEHYNRFAFEQDNSFITEFFVAVKQERKEKLQEKLKSWKQEKDKSFDGLWSDVKSDMLTKQEN